MRMSLSVSKRLRQEEGIKTNNYSNLSTVTYLSKLSFFFSMQDNTKLLLFIAKKTGLFGTGRITTIEAAKELNLSQQSASRKILLLEEKGYILRKPSKNGLEVHLSDKGREELKNLYNNLSALFKKKCLIGKIIDGLGEGRFYTSLEPYRKQFEKKLGFLPSPGTLNLKSDETSIKEFIAQKETIIIEGYNTSERTYGDIVAYNVKLKGKDAALILPRRSSHPANVFEIIAPFYIRGELNLKTGDEVHLE